MGKDFVQYSQQVNNNKHVISNLSKEKYPYLYNVLNNRGCVQKQRLLFILEMAQQIQNQEYNNYGYWFFMPLSRFANDGIALARTTGTWEKVIVLFCCLGLIERCIPTAETASTPYRRKAVECALRQRRGKCTAFISIPYYTQKQLDYAERKARLWTKKRGTFQHFSKTTVIEVFGSTTANRVYQDERRKPMRLSNAERVMITTLNKLLADNTFTTRNNLISRTPIQNAKATWERASNSILLSANAYHHRPTRKEKAAHNLSGNGWIITKINN